MLRTVESASSLRAAEFFAGIGLVRMGLELSGFEVVYANDIEAAKREMYEQHFGADDVFHLQDIADVQGTEVPAVDLAWASFPCTDLSLAGNRQGIRGGESGTFWHFVRILDEMGERRPPVVALENVVGLATSHGGHDLVAAIRALNDLDYSVDILTLDARRFVPQSRPRLFVVASQETPLEAGHEPNSELRPDWLQAPFGDPSLRMHRAELPQPPAPLTSGLGDFVQRRNVEWWEADRKKRFLDALSPYQAQRLEALRRGRGTSYRTAYRRTRHGVAMWEIRPDDIAGCLRTARGGSSKQAVVRAGQGRVDVRWMTPLEYARLMGAGNYQIEGLRPNQVLFGFGDAVCVPVVAWLAEHYLAPLLRGDLTDERRDLQAV